jgi:hypothetical protein
MIVRNKRILTKTYQPELSKLSSKSSRLHEAPTPHMLDEASNPHQQEASMNKKFIHTNNKRNTWKIVS